LTTGAADARQSPLDYRRCCAHHTRLLRLQCQQRILYRRDLLPGSRDKRPELYHQGILDPVHDHGARLLLQGSAELRHQHLLDLVRSLLRNKVRFLLPVALYRPGQSAPGTPPKDYVTYLRGLSSQGATLADEKKITVDGHSATLMTGTTEHGLDGSIGCPQTQGVPDAGGDCYGLQPDVALRIAVIDVSGRTLLAWARTNKGASDASAFFAEFEAMLQSIKFR
jgi:hypothetical protein